MSVRGEASKQNVLAWFSKNKEWASVTRSVDTIALEGKVAFQMGFGPDASAWPEANFSNFARYTRDVSAYRGNSLSPIRN